MKNTLIQLRRHLLCICGILLWLGESSAESEIIYLPLPGLDQVKQKVPAIDCWRNLHEIFSAAKRWSSQD